MNNKVTIITAVYNNQEDIINCIKSVEKQIYENWEHIIIDDCSTDNTYDTIISYLDTKYEMNPKDRKKIKVIKSNKNNGPYVCKNIALEQCSGDYICILDSDDEFHILKLKKQVNILDNNQELLWVYTYYRRDNAKRVTTYPEVTMMYRRKIIDDIGGYDSVRFGADSEFRDRITKKYGKLFKTIDKVLYYAKLRKNSLTNCKDNNNVRKDYLNSYTCWHNTAILNNTLYIPLLVESNKRVFDVPVIMLP
jgi:glycosyltransferase involved in cell wall biosynthesis